MPTINVAPTWSEVARIISAGLQSDSPLVFNNSKELLQDMARVAQLAVSMLSKLNAIEARIAGEWDNEDLRKFGDLTPNTDADIMMIINSNPK